MTPRIAIVVGTWLIACSAGGTPSSPSSPSFAVDPETEPLPAAPKAHIADPRSPLAFAPVDAKDPKPDPKPDVVPERMPQAKPAPKPAPAVAADCGSKENPCPMQKLMRGIGAASTPETLEAAFNRVAALSPNAGWQWAAIAKKGAELAKSGDAATSKKQCKACHDQYRDLYKSQYRARKL